MTSYHELETCYHIVITDGEVEWDPANVMMEINMPYGDKACVSEMYRRQSKGGLSEISHKIDLILGSITNSLLADIALEQLISAIHVKESVLSCINNGKAKAKMAHKKGTVRKVVANSRHYVVIP